MIEKINKILSEWDPIGVGYPLSLDEYKQYAPKIKDLINDEGKLKNYFIEILDYMGLNYDPNNTEQQNDIIQVTKKVLILKEKL